MSESMLPSQHTLCVNMTLYGLLRKASTGTHAAVPLLGVEVDCKVETLCQRRAAAGTADPRSHACRGGVAATDVMAEYGCVLRRQVLDFLSHVTLCQRYQNTDDTPIECVYTFPMDAKAAVNRLLVTVGDRVIEGCVMETAAARETYDAAVSAGAYGGCVGV